MGDLILMTRPTASSRATEPSGAGAEILFFTGVRYYRMPETDLAERVKPRRRRATKSTRRSAPLECLA